MNKNQYEEAPDLRFLAESVISAMPELSYIRDAGIRIAYLRDLKEKKTSGKKIYGTCYKVQDLYATLIPYDFIIVINEENTALFTENQLKILLWHELKHIGVDYDSKDLDLYIVPHDIEEFTSIIDRVGMDWSKEGTDVEDITAVLKDGERKES